MRLPTYFVMSLAAGLSFVGTGCQTHTTVIPMSNGYEEVSHPHHALIDEPEPPRISFQYRSADGEVTHIWPSLYGAAEVIKGDLAVFVAEKAYAEPDHTIHPRLFAVRSPELPLDITDEVLWRWSKANGKDFAKALEKFAGITPQENNGQLELQLEFWTKNEFNTAREDWPDQSVLRLDWKQVEEIIHAVKTKGVEEQDLRWHSKYIGEKF